jgi:hypothetical protein
MTIAQVEQLWEGEEPAICILTFTASYSDGEKGLSDIDKLARAVVYLLANLFGCSYSQPHRMTVLD